MVVPDIKRFEKWLIRCGAEVLEPVGEWEVLRVRIPAGIFVVHSTARGGQGWPEQLLEIARSYNSGINVPLAATRTGKRKRGVKMHQAYGPILKRDGSGCFYCGLTVAPPGSPVPDKYACTIEHLVSVCHGGPDHLSNKFLAHRKCNDAAGTLSAPEKIALRDRMRTEICGQ